MAALTEPRFGCQTYSWQLSLEGYRGRLPHMAQLAAGAGFTGFEPETIMLGPEWTPEELAGTLGESGLELAALCLVGEWRNSEETTGERAEADRVIAAVARIPGSIINLVMNPGEDRSDLRERQENALSCMSAIARRAESSGVAASFHPNSPPGSVFRTADDYELLRRRLHPLIGFTPDFGHIVKGAMLPLKIIVDWRDRIRHVHIKDIDASGDWAATGTGVLDIAGIVDALLESGYDGWIVFEDESGLAQSDPDEAVAASGRYVRDVLAPRHRHDGRDDG